MPIARPAASVALEGFELRVLHLPLVAPFTTSFGTETVREVIVVRALTADGGGWGEIVTQADPLYSSEYTQGAWDVALRFLAPALLDRRHLRPEDVAPILEPFKGHRMAKAGLELAVLDAALRAEGRTFGEYVGAVRDRVPSGVSVGIQRDPRRPGRRGARLPRRGLRAHQDQDQAGPRRRRHGRCARRLRHDPAAGRRELRLHAGGCRDPVRARPLRPAAHRAAAPGGRPRRPRHARAEPAHPGVPGRIDRVATRPRPTRLRWARHPSSTSRPDG